MSNIMTLGVSLVPSFDALTEMIEDLQRQMTEEGGAGMEGAMALLSQIVNYIFDLPQLFKNLSDAISVENENGTVVKSYDPEEGNYVAYLIETFIDGLEASLTLDLTDGADISITFGAAGGNFDMQLQLSLDVVQTPDIQSVYTKDAEGWYIYEIAA